VHEVFRWVYPTPSIGAVGGIPVSLLKVGSILLIVAGVVGLHLSGAGQDG